MGKILAGLQLQGRREGRIQYWNLDAHVSAELNFDGVWRLFRTKALHGYAFPMSKYEKVALSKAYKTLLANFWAFSGARTSMQQYETLGDTWFFNPNPKTVQNQKRMLQIGTRRGIPVVIKEARLGQQWSLISMHHYVYQTTAYLARQARNQWWLCHSPGIAKS